MKQRQKVSVPLVSKYVCDRGVCKLSLNKDLLDMLRAQGMELEGGMRCNVVIGDTSISIEVDYDNKGETTGRYLLSAVGRTGILQISSKDFSVCADYYTPKKVYAPATDPSFGPTATAVVCDRLVNVIAAANNVPDDNITDNLREQVNKLDDEVFTLRKALKGMIPTTTVLRCEACYCQPDTKSVLGYVACCGNLETYEAWNKLQNKYAGLRGRWASTYKDK